MLSQGLISADELREMEHRIDAVVQEAIRFAEESPYPEPHEALEDVFA
jgi:pyruvate dehydrogenase E1 component alpha subunit